MCEFRELNDLEKMQINLAVRQGRIPSWHELYTHIDQWRVSYEKMQGGFCICVLVLSIYDGHFNELHKIYRGASRRSYKDKRNETFGCMKAFGRAILYSRAAELR